MPHGEDWGSFLVKFPVFTLNLLLPPGEMQAAVKTDISGFWLNY